MLHEPLDHCCTLIVNLRGTCEACQQLFPEVHAEAYSGAFCHAGIEAWLREEGSSAAEQRHPIALAVQDGDGAASLQSESMQPEWHLWRAALHALAAIPQAQA